MMLDLTEADGRYNDDQKLIRTILTGPVDILVNHGGKIDPALIESAKAALGHAGGSIFRRNVSPSYTNTAIMGAGVTLVAGELLDEPRLLVYGRARIRRFVEHVKRNGEFDEYNSPGYTVVALDECEKILRFVHDPEALADAEAARRKAWLTIAEHYHPGTGQWAGPHGRNYHDLIDPKIVPGLLARSPARPAARPSCAAVSMRCRKTRSRSAGAIIRVRWQLAGPGASAAEIVGGSFALTAGDYRAVVHTADSVFGAAPMTWEIGSGDGDTVFVDGICHAGSEITFHPADVDPVVIAAGVEILRAGAAGHAEAPIVTQAGADTVKVDWYGLRVLAPTCAEPAG